jgi:hypothetical protein
MDIGDSPGQDPEYRPRQPGDCARARQHFAELIVYRFNIYLEQSKFCEHYFRYVTEMRTLV